MTAIAVTEPIDLDDEAIEGAVTIAEGVAYTLAQSRRGIVRILRELEAKYGEAGFAAVGRAILEKTEVAIEEYGAPDDDPPVNNLLLVGQCDECGKYRLGNKWLDPPWPERYEARDIVGACPECEAKHAESKGGK